jgi:hypothetical protein
MLQQQYLFHIEIANFDHIYNMVWAPKLVNSARATQFK